MCRTISIDGKKYETVGELRAAIGAVPIMDGYGEIRNDCCLCPVDIDAFVGRFIQVEHDGDPMDIMLVSQPKDTPHEK